MDAVSDPITWGDITGNITALGRAYFIFEKENAFEKVYWYLQQPAMEALQDFLAYYHQGASGHIYQINHGSDIAGYFFIHDLVIPHHCHIGAFVRRRYWGDFPEEFGRMLLPQVHEILGVERIYGITPSRAAASLAERIGMKPAGIIPQYAAGRDAYIFVG